MKNSLKLLILASIVSALSATTTHYIDERFTNADHENFIGIVKKGTKEQEVTKPGSELKGIYLWSDKKWQQLRNGDHREVVQQYSTIREEFKGTLPKLSPDLIKEINPFLQTQKKTPPVPPPSRQDPFVDPVQYVKRQRGQVPDPPIKTEAVKA
ncbi:hypothetical protein Ddc_15698 [Ditylenchus destructor]|nr:hypothetical protein Ddc_15698 [Ditylenchus destructor]